MRNLLAFKPVFTVTVALSGSNINTGAWTQLLAKSLWGTSAMEVFNPSASTIQIGVGASGHEVALAYTILPGGSAILLPMEIPAGSRISAQAVDADATTGQFTLNFFG